MNDPRMNRIYDRLPSWATGIVKEGDVISTSTTIKTTNDFQIPKIRGCSINSTATRNISLAQSRARLMAEAAQARGIQVPFRSDGSLPPWFVDMANRNFPSTGSDKITDSEFRKWVTRTVLSNQDVQNVRFRVTREETRSTTMRVPDRRHRFPVS